MLRTDVAGKIASHIIKNKSGVPFPRIAGNSKKPIFFSVGKLKMTMASEAAHDSQKSNFENLFIPLFNEI